ncbi:unnamed protein product, partial [Polarella glacialis]
VSHNFIDATCLPQTLGCLQKALAAFAERRSGGATGDEALEFLSEGNLDAPSASLLAASLHAPQAIAVLVSSAVETVRHARNALGPEEQAGKGLRLQMLERSISEAWVTCGQALESAAAGLASDAAITSPEVSASTAASLRECIRDAARDAMATVDEIAEHALRPPDDPPEACYPGRRLRVAVLHGTCSNSQVMEMQLLHLRTVCGDK